MTIRPVDFLSFVFFWEKIFSFSLFFSLFYSLSLLSLVSPLFSTSCSLSHLFLGITEDLHVSSAASHHENVILRVLTLMLLNVCLYIYICMFIYM